ncbi:unnamed protein product [Polarella glacialis]|uniref:Chloride channel protein n=1 Tax=Polarella glacialis TaxID=89957 RepID=A0A813FF84_POLGL|nr:unnamed protein product [Polarella glacialis]
MANLLGTGSLSPRRESPQADELSPHAEYRFSNGNGGDASDSDGLDPRGGVSAAKGGRQLPCAQLLVAEVVLSLIPWLNALLLGVLTALTGSFIALNCDFLGDLRFGFCQGIFLADRNRCCGGSENVDFLRDRCIVPAIADTSSVQWITWAVYFGLDSKVKRGAGYLLAFFMYVASSVCFTGLASFIVFEYALAARGSGIPEVKAAVSGFDLPHSFSAWCLFIKALGLSLVVGAGLSLGKEGPMIHIGVCWAYILHRVSTALGLPTGSMPLHEIACVGAAAGVSSAFGAPLGGVLFAAEASLGRRTLLLAPIRFVRRARKEWIAWEMVAFLLTGVLGGLVGVLFIKAGFAAGMSRYWPETNLRRDGR